jgi:D-alanyl-D-alanine carboxypeptidase/D-alanyl-D-alanine-endopeptidase (penicillin-binding protein 4)
MVNDISTNEPLQKWNESELLCPGSVWKLVTTSTAIESLGPEFKFRTQLVYTGLLVDGVLEGDLILIGSGDPSLGSRHFGSNLEVFIEGVLKSVREAGIDSISGNIVVNTTHFMVSGAPPNWTWEDLGNYYGTAAYGFNIADNTYEVEFSVPDIPGEKAEIVQVTPFVPKLNIESEVLSSTLKGDRAFIFGAPMSYERVVRGTLPAGAGPFSIKGSIPNPAEFAAYHIHSALKKSGIHTSGYRVENSEYIELSAVENLGVFESPPLRELVSHINRESDNLYAESILLQIGTTEGSGTLEGSLEVVKEKFETKCGLDYSFFAYDGSGLSRFTAISAEQLSCLLHEMWLDDSKREKILDELPSAGKEGTMKWFGRNTVLEGNLKAKSGSMEGVKAYAGSFKAMSGRQLSFAILINNFQGSPTRMTKLIEDYLIRVYGDY